MRRRALIPVVAYLIGGGELQAAPPKHTLPELVRMVRERGRNVAAAKAQVQVAETMRSEARRLWFPVGDVSYSLTGAPSIKCQPSVAECVSTVNPKGDPVSFLTLALDGAAMQFQLNFAQPLFTSGKIHNIIQAANHNIEVNQANVDKERAEAELWVTRAYWGLKGSRAALATLEDVVAELKPWLTRIEEGLEKPHPEFNFSDLERLKVALAQVKVVIADMRRNVATALAGLRALVQEEVDVDDAELEPIDVVPRGAEFFVEQALRHRPEVRQLDAARAALRSVSNLRISELLPDIGLWGGAAYRYAPTMDDPQNAFMNHANGVGLGVFLTVRQPIDIFQRLARMSHSRADLMALSSQRAFALQGISFDVERIYADLQEARERMQATEEGQRTARGWFNSVKQAIDVGTGEPRDLVEAARGYFELRLRYYQAIVDVNVQLANLQRATGTDVVKN